MKLQKRVNELEKKYSIVDPIIVRICRIDTLVRLDDGREMTYEEYQRQLASGVICQQCKYTLVKKKVLNNTITILNGGRR